MKNKKTEFEKKWGEVCKICKLRKGSIASLGHNLPKTTNTCQCD